MKTRHNEEKVKHKSSNSMNSSHSSSGKKSAKSKVSTDSQSSRKSSSHTNTNSKSKELRNQTKTVKQSLTASERLCNRCKAHQRIETIKGHTCPFVECNCYLCKDYEEKTRRKRENAMKRRHAIKDQNKDHKKSEGVHKSFVNSLKAKSKKFLNKNKDQIQKPIERNNNRSEREGNDSNEDTLEDNDYQNQAMDGNDAPPKLIRQPTISGSSPPITTGSATAPELPSASSPKANENHWPYPAKSSPSLCAQYLKACGELSRKLSKYQLTSDEMIACFKYSTIRDCLGDVEVAAEKIAFASQEIRLGAAFNIQHPNEGPDVEECPSGSGAHQTAQSTQTSSKKTNPNPMLCSTLNGNFRANSAVNYSPAFTPIRHN